MRSLSERDHYALWPGDGYKRPTSQGEGAAKSTVAQEPAARSESEVKWRCWPWKHVWYPGGHLDYWDQHANYRRRAIQRCTNCRAWRWTPR